MGKFWTINNMNYLKVEVANVQEVMKGIKWILSLKPNVKMSMELSYFLELNSSIKLDIKDIHYNQELIGKFRLMTEIVRVDTLHEIVLLSQYLFCTYEIILHDNKLY